MAIVSRLESLTTEAAISYKNALKIHSHAIHQDATAMEHHMSTNRGSDSSETLKVVAASSCTSFHPSVRLLHGKEACASWQEPLYRSGVVIMQSGEAFMKLYNLELSGNCYKVRLLAALARIPLENVPMDFTADEQRTAWFTALNPFQEVPVLVDGETVLRDSQAILVYLGGQLADRSWWPQEPAAQAEIVQWLSIAASEVRDGPNTARLIRKFGYDRSMESALRVTQRLLPLLEQHLSTHDWFALHRPTIAECALFPYLALTHEGGIDVTPFRALTRWFDRVRALPGFVPMPGVDK